MDRKKLAFHFDPERLLADLKNLESIDWTDHFVTQNYEGNWSVIPLRGPANASHPVMMIYSDPTCTEFADTPFLQQCPYFQSVLATFNCPLEAVRLMKLSPGSRIKQHSDHDLDLESGTVRMHVPIITNQRVRFWLNDSQLAMAAGECWYLRLSDPHRVENNGDSDRVHLVIDARVNDWLRSQLS